MNKVESLHPCVIVCDHFDRIKNTIDIKIESLLADKNLSDDMINVLNALRQDQIAKINEIQEINLSNIKFDEDQYKHEWKHVLNDISLDYNQKVEIIKEKLISYDCFVVEEPKTKFKMSLFITPWFNHQTSLEFIKLV